jgi:Galactoside-binding lectin/RNA recognition motif. (a.k.a. RRM, RBD, or RNP domain)
MAAPPPPTASATGRASSSAEAARLAKYNLYPFPESFQPTAEEKALLDMYEAIRAHEREATRLKEKKAREKIYAKDDAANNDVDDAPALASSAGASKKRKASRTKKARADKVPGLGGREMSDDEDDNSASDDEDDVGVDGESMLEKRAAKLEALRDEIEDRKNAMDDNNATEERMRKELLQTNEDDLMHMQRVVKKNKVVQNPGDGGPSLLSNMVSAKTPPHEFSEKLGLKDWKGTVLFPLSQDEPTWTPPEQASDPNDGAFLTELQEFDISGATNGLGNNTLAIKFNAPADSRRFSFNIAGPGHDDFDSVLFHFNPRQRQKGGQLVINDKQSGIWGRALSLPLSQVPLIFGQTSVTLLVQVTGNGFDVFIEGKHCARLEHRIELPSKPCSLYLQFPSCDDYRSPENWIVYKAWWGNKELMAKEDASGVPGVNSFDATHPRKLFIKGLKKLRTDAEVEIRRAELERAFRKYGGARGVNTIVGKNSTFAFVEMESERMATLALEEMRAVYPQMSKARRSKHELLMEEREAAEAAKQGKSKESGDW